MVKIAFLGDISLNNSYNEFKRQDVNPFLGVERILRKSDFSIGNLECMVQGDYGENELKYPRLSTKVETLDLLKYLNLKVLTLAHNHVYDNLLDGFQKTVNVLDTNNISYLGAGLTKHKAESELILTEDGVKIGLLNFVTLDTNPKIPENAKVWLNIFDKDYVERSIQNLRPKVDQLVVLLHWGGRVEEGFFPDFDQPMLARRMIDSGADLIIGGHSHTIQPYEIYKGKHVFYSLGNFCFDDIVHGREVFQIGRFRKRKTIIPIVKFTKESYIVEVYHAKNTKGFIVENTILQGFRLFWRNAMFNLTKKSSFIWKFYFWHLKKIVPIKIYFFESNEGFMRKLFSIDFHRVKRYLIKK